ncbi:predicted protein [Histoplasma capsulatum G186AR]|uniref:Uncharacterized protein n=2 Tax=Ajellomyces capsulatus TaxID=5037 RepID=C0NBB6_AJECG|nr:uncharacterized protein HCBG_00412 [Histoplasma capsulatum G186AR]EEH10957.1 predicted protein [Histoplasma capsulatum G186AR]KAG5288826.1 hypothetical protein I7I52_12435 [Histoplasma capsulatum]QSS71403.1 hypothetical protein I7I50_02221 [Histoplasma capsulatum G186AR]
MILLVMNGIRIPNLENSLAMKIKCFYLRQDDENDWERIRRDILDVETFYSRMVRESLTITDQCAEKFQFGLYHLLDSTRTGSLTLSQWHSHISARQLNRDARLKWWSRAESRLSRWYRSWRHTGFAVEYEVKAPTELALLRHALHCWLAARSSHGDFTWYHRCFRHEDAKLCCMCEHNKRPAVRPCNRATAIAYLGSLILLDFMELLEHEGPYLGAQE